MRDKNARFIALFHISKWSRSEAARKLDSSPENISRYLNGKMEPNNQALLLFQHLVEREQPGALLAAATMSGSALADWERELIEDLRWLRAEDRERVLKALKALTEGLPRRERRGDGSSSGPSGPGIQGIFESEVEATLRELQQGQLKPGVESPSGRKDGPGRGARRRKGTSLSPGAAGARKHDAS